MPSTKKKTTGSQLIKCSFGTPSLQTHNLLSQNMTCHLHNIYFQASKSIWSKPINREDKNFSSTAIFLIMALAIFSSETALAIQCLFIK